MHIPNWVSTNASGAAHAREDDHIEQLVHRTLQQQPLSDPVEVAAVTVIPTRLKRRPPERLEAVTVVDRRNAAEAGVHENHISGSFDRHVMTVQIARAPDAAGDEQTVETVVQPAVRERILQAPDLVARAEVDRPRARCRKAHALVERSLERRQATVLSKPDQEQLRRGDSEREAHSLFGQPGFQPRRVTDLELAAALTHRRRISSASSITALAPARSLAGLALS